MLSMKCIYLAILMLAMPLVGLLLTGCMGHRNSSNLLAVRVAQTAPANGETAVPTNCGINATFGTAMDPLTLTATTFLVAGAGPGTITYDVASRTATFRPIGNLAINTVFTATITTGAKDSSGLGLFVDYVWSFTTGSASDNAAPTAVSSAPAAFATNVPINSLIQAAFSEQIQPSTITEATFTLMAGATPVFGAVSYVTSGSAAKFAPSIFLTPNTSYTATITTGVQDLAGNPISRNFVWTFVTGAVADNDAPTVESLRPTNSETNVALNSHVIATFSEAMDPATMTTTNVTVMRPDTTLVSGTVSYVVSSKIVIFRQSGNLSALTTFTATLTTGVKDTSGNPLAENYVWNFTTGTSLDTTAPLVTATNPVDGATSVPQDIKVMATFTEAMSSETINQSTFTLAQGVTPIEGCVSYFDLGTSAVFSPASTLLPGTSYTATIKVTTGVRDQANNAMASNFVWVFTTGTGMDTASPTAITASPASNATSVALDTNINVTFSEPMDAATITALTYKLTGPGVTAISGSVGYNVSNRIATFTPSANLATNTLFTATVTVGAADAAKNALASEYVWTFTTGAESSSAPLPINLRSAGAFAVFAGSTITSTGPARLNGDLGLSPGTAVTGFPPGIVNGTTHAGDATATQAKLDVTTAFDEARALSTGAITLPENLGGMTITPGLYNHSSSAQIAGTAAVLTLDALGDPSAVFIFNIVSTLTTSSGSSVVLSGGARATNVFWSVGSSATLGTASVFCGSILADQSITVTDGVEINGRALSRVAAVTLDSNIITAPSR